VKEIVGPVDLLNRHTSVFEEARIVRGLDEQNLDDFVRHWRPMLQERRAQFPDNVAACEGNVQDWHWDWIVESYKAQRNLGYDVFGIECDGRTQALMVVDSNQFASHSSHKGKELVRIARLATAPWNRIKTVQNPKYRGAGLALLATAISLSIELEFGGRIGLHALPQSEDWYRSCGFLEVPDPNPENKLKYFEMTADAAVKFLQEGE
jgi:hypothetical protein